MKKNTKYFLPERISGGFTLVEVVVVLVILAIMASMLVPSLTGYIDKANETAAIAECRSCVVAAQSMASEAYAVDHSITEADYEEVEALAEIGSGKKIELISIEDGNKLVHLIYNSGRYRVTYCAKRGCEECGNNDTYNVVKVDEPASVQSKADSAFSSVKDVFVSDYIATMNNKRIDGVSASVPGTKAYAIYNSLTADQQKFLDGVTWSIVPTNVDVTDENNVTTKKTVYRIYFTTEKYTSADSAKNVKVYKYNLDGTNGKSGQYEYTTTGVVQNGKVMADGKEWSDWSDTID